MRKTKEYLQLRKDEVQANYEAFKQELPELMNTKHKGEYALMRNRQIKDFFPDFHQAVTVGNKRFKGKPFSVQHIDDKPIDLGIRSIY